MRFSGRERRQEVKIYKLKTFFIEKNANFETCLSKLGFHCQVNVDAHVTTTLRCSQINSMTSR